MTLSACASPLNRHEQRLLNLLRLFNRTRYPLLLKDLVRITQWDDEALSRCCSHLTELGLLRRISAHKGWLLTRLGRDLLLEPAAILEVVDTRSAVQAENRASQNDKAEAGEKNRGIKSLRAGADGPGISPGLQPVKDCAGVDGAGINPSLQPAKGCAGEGDLGIIPSPHPVQECGKVDGVGIIPSPCAVQECAGVDGIGIIPCPRPMQGCAGNNVPVRDKPAMGIPVAGPEIIPAVMADPGVNQREDEFAACEKTGLLTESCKSPARGRNYSDSQDRLSIDCLSLKDKRLSSQSVYILTDKTKSDSQTQVGKIPTPPQTVAFPGRLPRSPTPRRTRCNALSKCVAPAPASRGLEALQRARRQAPRRLPQPYQLPGNLHGPAP